MDSDTSNKSLKDLLAEVLPKNIPFTFYHISTPPTKSPALYSAPPQLKPERTYCESHFLSVSIRPPASNTSVASDELLILAIEVLIYTTKKLTTIFVSKADSTGCISALNLPRSQAGSPLKNVAGTFVSWLVKERQRPGKRLVVSLFARAQDQYLFPASVDNPNKHVLDDRGLIKWWCRVLDPLIQEYAPEEEQKPLRERLAQGSETQPNGFQQEQGKATAKGYLIIPGFDLHDTKRYVPTSIPNAPSRWSTQSHPLLTLAPYPSAPPRCLIPHFPDDPKSRYLSELDEELPDRQSDDLSQAGGTPSRSNGQWKSVKSLDQFWDMMAFRQECASGRCVGFIWVVITPPQDSIPEEEEDAPTQQSLSQESATDATPSATSSPKKRKPRRMPVNTNHGPIPLRLPRIKSTSSNLSASSAVSSLSANLPSISTPYFLWPPSSRGTLLFSPKEYARACEILLQQNFATAASSARSTKRWKEEVGVLAGTDAWGWTIIGRKEGAVIGNGGVGGDGGGPVNVLSGKKRRKEGDAGVKTLGEGLVRKKVKVEENNTTLVTSTTNGVNTLNAGLVRKKPKA